MADISGPAGLAWLQCGLPFLSDMISAKKAAAFLLRIFSETLGNKCPTLPPELAKFHDWRKIASNWKDLSCCSSESNRHLTCDFPESTITKCGTIVEHLLLRRLTSYFLFFGGIGLLLPCRFWDRERGFREFLHWLFSTLVVKPSKNCSFQTTLTRWWFQIFFISTLNCGSFPFWLIFFKGLKPPTRNNT